jgi:hypothetical protein
MILFAPFICWYVFWKTMYKELELDFDIYCPVLRKLAMCAK